MTAGVLTCPKHLLLFLVLISNTDHSVWSEVAMVYLTTRADQPCQTEKNP